MGHFLDIDAWKRRAQFEFFQTYQRPFFNICAEVDVTDALNHCRQHDHSFFLASWFLCTQAANDVEPFRYRLRGDKVWVHDQISVGTTVLNPDETFSFCYLPVAMDFASFARDGLAAVNATKEGRGLEPLETRDDLIYGSVLPWLRFTSVSHAQRDKAGESVPKIVFGRHTKVGDRVMMPVSVEVHHALMDGLHVSRFFGRFEEYLAQAAERLGEGKA